MTGRLLALALAGALTCSTAAQADCTFAVGPCSTDSNGNTYRTERNLGGGHSTTQNGSSYSTTTQTLGGGYREDFNSGGSRFHTNPYGSTFDQRRPGYR